MKTSYHVHLVNRAGFLSTLTIATLALLVGANAHAARVKADGFVLKVNGEPFVIKGMNYSPVPTGAVPSQPPYGDYFVKAYDNVWKPDIDNIRAAGVNVIKLYAGNPGANAGSPGSAGNWKQFLDYCYNGGVKPIYVIMFSYTQGGVIEGGGGGLQGYINDYTAMVKSTVKHPAVFGYLVGNEIFGGVSGSSKFWTNYGKLVDAAHDAAITQRENAFLTTAIVDNYTPSANWPAIRLGEQSGQLKNLDAWSINVYRGPELGGTGNLVFPQYKALMGTLGKTKPMILGEWGTPHTTRPQALYSQNVKIPVRNLDEVPQSEMGPGQPYFAAMPVAQFLTSLWNVIETNIGAGSDQVCVGGFLFGWCDEYWKGDNPNNQVGGPAKDFQGGAFAGGYADEAGYGITGSVDQSRYGAGRPNIVRPVFLGYGAVSTFFNASSQTGSELYSAP